MMKSKQIYILVVVCLAITSRLVNARMPTIIEGEASNAFLGISVEVDGDSVILGVPGTVPNWGFSETPHSSLIVNASTGTPTTVFPVGEPGDVFGSAVALRGNIAAIGAFLEGWTDPQTAETIQNTGAAYLYDVQNNEILQEIDPPNPHGDTSFGLSIAIDNQIVVVGSRSSAHIYELDTLATGGPVTSVSIEVSGGELESTYVDADGGVAIVGSPREVVDGVPGAGLARVIDTTGRGLSKELQAPSAQHGAEFGISVAILGNLALVGAPNDPGDEGQQPASGAAYLFDIPTGEMLHRFAPPTGVLGQRFGRSVAMHGNVAAINAFGKTHLFDLSTHELLTTLLLQADRGEVNIALSDQWLVAGSPLASSSNGPLTGVANIFDISFYASGLSGDFNGDLVVNIADYTVWRDNSLSIEDYQT